MKELTNIIIPAIEINDELLKRIINLYQPSFIFSNKKKKIEDTNEYEIKSFFLYENKKFKSKNWFYYTSY